MKKKIFTIVLALCLVFSLGATAFAADGTPADGPNGGGTANPSSSAAIVEHDGTDFTTENDDDNLAKASDTNGADISVWGRIAGAGTVSGTVIYKLDVAWGAMQFEFDRGNATWDTTTHTYSGASEGAKWTNTYVNGIDNKITVTNHSNSAIDATFACALETGAFNAAAGADAVVGNFFDDNPKAITAAGVLTDVANVQNRLNASSITLETAVAYSTNGEVSGNVEAGARADDVFFAFSGTPDPGKTLADFSKVGTITITFTRNAKTYQSYQ